MEIHFSWDTTKYTVIKGCVNIVPPCPEYTHVMQTASKSCQTIPMIVLLDKKERCVENEQAKR